jgi:hypothetical protein
MDEVRPAFARRRSKLGQPIEEYRREVKQILEPHRLELIRSAGTWIAAHEDRLLANFADGNALDLMDKPGRRFPDHLTTALTTMLSNIGVQR